MGCWKTLRSETPRIGLSRCIVVRMQTCRCSDYFPGAHKDTLSARLCGDGRTAGCAMVGINCNVNRIRPCIQTPSRHDKELQVLQGWGSKCNVRANKAQTMCSGPELLTSRHNNVRAGSVTLHKQLYMCKPFTVLANLLDKYKSSASMKMQHHCRTSYHNHVVMFGEHT